MGLNSFFIQIQLITYFNYTLEKSGHDDIAYTSSIQKFENGVNEVCSLLGTNFPIDSFQEITQNMICNFWVEVSHPASSS